MKSPEELARRFARQWENTDLREERLLGDGEAWPISLPIGRPAPRALAENLDTVKRHIERWRRVSVGEIIWDTTSYRAAAEPVRYPSRWELRDAREWIAACGDGDVRKEWESLRTFIEETLRVFHPSLVRRRSLWRGRADAEVVMATRLALAIEPGCAEGRPLRAISLAGIDTKFFERNDPLITALLDARFDGDPSRLGLARFLDAAVEADHWFLIADLDGSLLPFKRQRVPSSELQASPLPGRGLIIVENESSLHQLPHVSETIAVLGAGFDLTWTTAPWLRGKEVAYWGDIDTWGLQFLARARVAIPHLTPLLMTSEVFDAHKGSAVREPVHARGEAPKGLTPSERVLYERLLDENRGRLEQEFLPTSLVEEMISRWAGDAGSTS